MTGVIWMENVTAGYGQKTKDLCLVSRALTIPNALESRIQIRKLKHRKFNRNLYPDHRWHTAKWRVLL